MRRWNKKREDGGIFPVINNLILLCLLVICFYPLFYVLLASLSDSSLLMAHRGLLAKPLGFTLLSYAKVFDYPMVLTGYGNTLFVVVMGTLVNMIMTTLGAYFLSRKNVLLQGPVLALILITMFFSGGLVPLYLLVKSLHLDNTLWSLILPTAVNTFNLIILRTGFAGIPDSLEESAKIDGANPWTVFIRIYLPLVKPTLAVIVLYYAVDRWNAWFYASIFLNDRNLFPLQLVLREILILNDTNAMTGGTNVGDVQGVSESIKYTVIIVATLPILFVYPFLQKYFVKGVMVGAVKG